MLLPIFRELFPVLAALYLIDAFVYVRRAQFLFAVRLAGGYALKERGVRVASLWPGDVAFLMPRPPLMAVPAGVYLLDAEPGPAIYDPASWSWIAFADLPPPAVDGEAVRFGSSHRLALASAAEATAEAERLVELRRLEPAQRELRLDELATAAFCRDALTKRRDAFRARTSLLRWSAFAYALLLLIVLPVVLYASPAAVLLLPPVAILTGAAYLAVLGAAIAAVRSLRRHGIPVSRGAVLGMTFSPPAAIHAASSLGRELLRGFDPLAAAAVLLPRDELLRRARAELHGARCAAGRSDEPGWRQHWSARQSRILKLLAETGIDAGEAAGAPLKRDSAAASYCPVCATEFRAGFDSCDDCGLPLQAFPADSL